MSQITLTKGKVKKLLTDLESEQIERTTSKSDTEKFAQAVCAFSNDLSNSSRNGYLLIGVNDNGTLSGLKATDKLLQSLGGLRSDGNILPQPIMSTQAFSFSGGDVIVLEIQPSPFPPVRYKGRTWIRVGPRKAIASDMEERLLIEKRTANVSTFDIRPSQGNGIDALNTRVFIEEYLPNAVQEDELALDNRSVEEKLASLRFYSSNYGSITNAGLLLFGKDVESNIPGAYIQYVKFSGRNEASDVQNEKKFSGNLIEVLQELDTFIEYVILQQKPVAVSVLKENKQLNYPQWALRELLMNAIMHRDYESNAPVKFYQYSDRIEVINPGGLYGNARPENFPNVNDYRNPVIAEAMKILGYVNRFNRGIARVKAELEENGNPEPEFDYERMGVFGVTVFSTFQEGEMKKHAEENQYTTKDKFREKTREKTREKILRLISENKEITIQELSKEIGITEKGIEYQLKKLRKENVLKRIGPDKGGYWEIQ